MAQAISGPAGAPLVHAAPDDRAVQLENSPTIQTILRLVAQISPVAAADLAELRKSPMSKAAKLDAERTQRLLEDEETVRQLREVDFAGPKYDRFAMELARYSVAVLQAWMYTGHVFTVMAARRFFLNPTAHELHVLHTDPTERAALANLTVAKTLKDFKERALRGGKWDRAGGASIPTYFMGATTYVFPNLYREWQAEQRAWSQGVQAEAPTGLRISDDPAVAAAVQADLLRYFATLEDRDRALVQMIAYGYTQAEIAETLGFRTVRAVEGRLYRLRKKMETHKEQVAS